MTTDQQEVAARIAHLREELSLSQAELAGQIGLDRTAVSRIESGSRKISAYEIAGIAEALGVSVEAVLGLPVRDTNSFAVALRCDDPSQEGARPALEWFRDAVEDFLALRKL